MTDTKSRKRSHHADVMVSSTSLDLPDHRKAAIDAIWRRRMFPLAMESGVASSGDAISFSLKLVDECEVYVGIFGYRYGYILDDPIRNPDNLSVTELEYRQAVKRGIPIRIFLMDKLHPPPPGKSMADLASELETDPNVIRKLKELKAELSTRVVSFFTSPDDLSAKLYQSLTELHESGEIQYDDEGDADADETGIPKPPEMYVVHPYVLTRTFFGRKAELAKLDEWEASSDTMLIVEAIGGVGKSALTWQWVQQHTKDYDGVLWWSFYEAGSDVENFTQHAIAYLTGQPLDEFSIVPYAERVRRLVALLKQKRILLVLDGIERILVAYHRHDAPRASDEDVPDDADKRICTNPNHGTLLEQLTACAPSKILISTRLIPRDLQNKGGKLRDGVKHLHLNGLHPDDALALMRHLGVTGNVNAIKAYTSEFDNHSLLIGVLAGKINEYRLAPGNFDKWTADPAEKVSLAELDLSQKRTHILEYALKDLKPELLKLLGQIAAFRHALNYETLVAFNPYLPPTPVEPEKPDESRLEYFRHRLKQTESGQDYFKNRLAEENIRLAEYREAKAAYHAAMKQFEVDMAKARAPFHKALDELEGRGLLQWDRATNTYDLHPVVRGTAFDRATDDDRKQHFNAIRDHFENLPPENLDEVRVVNDLRRSLEIYYALVGAGLLDLAGQFYWDRLARVLQFNVAAYHAIIELLKPLFPDGIHCLPRLTSPKLQGNCATGLANAFFHLGRLDAALTLNALKLKLDIDSRDASSLSTTLGNLGVTLHASNALNRALQSYRLAQAVAEAINDHDSLDYPIINSLKLYMDIGDWATGDGIYAVLTANGARAQSSYWQAVIEEYYAESLLPRGIDPAKSLNSLAKLADVSNNALARSGLEYMRGEQALRNENPILAIENLNEAIRMARQSGSDDIQLYMQSLALARAIVGEHDAALLLLEGGFEEDKVSNCITVAETYLVLGEHDKAKRIGVKAYKWAWADGPPYVMWWELERAKRVLDEVGEPYPDMPPFDPDKVEPIPHEDEIRAFIEELKAKKLTENQNSDFGPFYTDEVNLGEED